MLEFPKKYAPHPKDRRAMSDVPEYALRPFRNSSAQPRVTFTYRLASGWEKAIGKPLFTRDVAARLLYDGVTLVKLRWHREDHQVTVSAHGLRSDPR
jgi:hypothetical protein